MQNRKASTVRSIPLLVHFGMTLSNLKRYCKSFFDTLQLIHGDERLADCYFVAARVLPLRGIVLI